MSNEDIKNTDGITTIDGDGDGDGDVDDDVINKNNSVDLSMIFKSKKDEDNNNNTNTTNNERCTWTNQKTMMVFLTVVGVTYAIVLGVLVIRKEPSPTSSLTTLHPTTTPTPTIYPTSPPPTQVHHMHAVVMTTVTVLSRKCQLLVPMINSKLLLRIILGGMLVPVVPKLSMETKLVAGMFLW